MADRRHSAAYTLCRSGDLSPAFYRLHVSDYRLLCKCPQSGGEICTVSGDDRAGGGYAGRRYRRNRGDRETLYEDRVQVARGHSVQ